MFKLMRRGLAYFIDMLVVLIIVESISGIGFINKNLDNYNKVTENYMNEFSEYSSFVIDINEYYEDNKLTSEEYDELISDNSMYASVVDKYYKDEKLTEKNYEKLIEDANDIYLDNTSKTYYDIDKYSIVYNITYVVVTFLYFVLFNMLTKGATLGKKLLRLKIVNNKNRDNKVSFVSYLIRYVMLYQVIYYLFKVIFVYVLGSSNYFNVANVVYEVHSYLLLLILVFVIVRMDGRGLHDVLSNTIVVSVDRRGNEIVKNDKKDEVVEAEIVEENEVAKDVEVIEEPKEEEIVKQKKETKSNKKTKEKRTTTKTKKVKEEK